MRKPLLDHDRAPPPSFSEVNQKGGIGHEREPKMTEADQKEDKLYKLETLVFRGSHHDQQPFPQENHCDRATSFLTTKPKGSKRQNAVGSQQSTGDKRSKRVSRKIQRNSFLFQKQMKEDTWETKGERRRETKGNK